MANENNILIQLLESANSWRKLKPELSKLNTSKSSTSRNKTIAGKVFEYFCKYYFTIDPTQDEFETVWLYEEIPENIRTDLQLPPIDHGIDILLKNRDGDFCAVQCKFKNDETKSLSWSGDKIANVFALGTNCRYILVISNCTDVTKVAKGFEEKYIQILNDGLSEITEETFERILEQAKGEKPKKPVKATPYQHQEKAIQSVKHHFTLNNRGQIILPCGAGKTLTSLWIKERIKAKQTLVLVPSLALLKQIKNDWAHQKRIDYRYICVCSEKDIDNDSYDVTVSHIYELGATVTTDKTILKKFLSRNSNNVIFSTYQSIGVIESALLDLPDFEFDLTICDEAHRTAGTKDKNTFTIIHDNARIRAKKRLYMTATPRVVSTKLKNKLGADSSLICDMSDPLIFGLEAFRMSFGEAIEQGVLVDYKIIGIGVTDSQVKRYIDQRAYTGNETLEDLAHNYALEMVMNKYGAFHGLTFHSRVKLAEAFSERHSHLFQKIFSKSVNGKQSTTFRKRVLEDFKNSDKGVISNARCLTEGVDIPTIDLIYFCDPKTSKIDIIQASGRALRKDRSGKKTQGLIVIPIFHHVSENLEHEIKKKPIFNYMIQVVRSLCDQDERLESEINKVAYQKGRKDLSHLEIASVTDDQLKIFQVEGLREKIKTSLYDEVIHRTKTSWEQHFLELQEYKEEHGHFDVPSRPYRYLAHWIREQRRLKRRNQLDPLKEIKLNNIGFDWREGLLRNFEENFKLLVQYKREHGHPNINRYDKSYGSLGEWLYHQVHYFKKGKLRAEYERQLRSIGVKLDIDTRSSYEKAWLNQYSDLKDFFAKNGHSNVTTEHYNSKLYNWVRGQRVRFRKNKLSKDRILLLNKVEFPWEVPQHVPTGFVRYDEEAWKKNYGNLRKFYIREGHSNVPQLSKKFKRLGRWVNDQRSYYKKGTMPSHRIQLLNKLDFVWEAQKLANDQAWNEKFDLLKEFKIQHGHFNISQQSDTNKALYYWLYRMKKKGTTQERWIKLKKLGYNVEEIAVNK